MEDIRPMAPSSSSREWGGREGGQGEEEGRERERGAMEKAQVIGGLTSD